MSKGTPITMPQLAESVVSATVQKWLKQPGETVDLYDPLCEIVTDKVTAELPSTAAGVITEILVGEGTTVDVGTVVCYIQEEGGQAATVATETVAVAPAAAVEAPKAAPAAQTVSEHGDSPMRHRLSPAVRMLADENGLDLNLVAGSGEGGRITRKDVLNYIASGAPKHVPVAPVASKAVPQNVAAQAAEVAAVNLRTSGIHLTKPDKPVVESSEQVEQFIDVTPVRNAIASKMRQSVSEIPHAWTMIEVDVTNIVLLRNKLKDEFYKREGIKLTYLPFVIKAVVNAIRDYPILNSVWAVDKIIVKRDINVSLAIGTEDAVYVPVIKQADQKTLAGIARDIDELQRKARNGTLGLADMQGGTFTVNNTGAFGSILSQPIINYPQAANFTMEAIVKKPVVIDDMIAVRSMVNFCLSLDHRILDGVICGRFMQRVKENLESYNMDTKLY
jgi:2-oxoisovalerate dehydrogenase E2 component (dihydrolipoyl transacylase)